MVTGFVKLNREFLSDGRTLLVAGLRDESGRILATRTRVLEADATADDAFLAWRDMYGDVPVTGLSTVFGKAGLN